MNLPPDDGVNVWHQSRTVVGTATIGPAVAFFLGLFDITRGVFNAMTGIQPEQYERDVTWLGQWATLYVASPALLPANGVYIGWYSRFQWGVEITSDEVFMGVGTSNATVKGVLKAPLIRPYITNVMPVPVSVSYCFRVLQVPSV